ncbi:ScbR family autoregulator-binding transcription factor [Streptomyces sp. TRM70308]|uniref:ScbR family autoregulator-binding transcription factor n=1 Tax=Streptomyces sp. TRM70308 TaxID=3131932 RepID=UPI003D06C1EC
MVKQERAARTRRALVRAAAEVFAEEGFTPASLSAISRRAGVSNGGLHFHFDSKDALARAVEDEAAGAVRRMAAAADEEPGGALQSLVDATHHLVDRLASDVVVRAGFELWRDPARSGGTALRGWWARWVEDTLRRADAEGGLAAGVATGPTARTIVAATVGFELLGAQDGRWPSGEDVTQFWELLLPRLAAPDASVSARPPAGPAGGPPGARCAACARPVASAPGC